ncbi:hypothetical protein OAS11_01580 [Paracoccaceae bacterium]|nr:hypothetical protein [Paracoccaceae bacterium]
MKNIYRFLFGRFFWVQYSKKLEYKGTWKKGLFHGKGTLRYANGSTYKGEFFGGAKNGYGHYISPKGYEYIGDWVGGKQTGKAQVNYKNGDLYKGKVKDGLRHGPGELFQVSSSRNYKGKWTKDTLQGEIEITDPNWIFHGSMHVSTGNGAGTFNYKNGAKYSGQVVDLKREGEGTLKFKSGEIISGVWTGNVNVKSASIIDELGFQWMGDLHNMQPSGRMKTKRPDGIIYDSVWENGAMLQSLSVSRSLKRSVQ